MDELVLPKKKHKKDAYGELNATVEVRGKKVKCVIKRLKEILSNVKVKRMINV